MNASTLPETIVTEEHDTTGGVIFEIRLNNPATKNSLTFDMADGMRALTDYVAERRDIAAVVVTGAGDVFCSGGDLSWLSGSGDTPVEQLSATMKKFYLSFLNLGQVPVPTIAAVEGAAIGAGMAFAAGLDLRVVSTSAKLSVAFTSLGIHPGMATTLNIPRLLGDSVSRDLFLTGRMARGGDADMAGFASRLVEPGTCRDTALNVAHDIAKAGPTATSLTLATLRGHMPDVAVTTHNESLSQALTMTTPDALEGLSAKKERRSPRFAPRSL